MEVILNPGDMAETWQLEKNDPGHLQYRKGNYWLVRVGFESNPPWDLYKCYNKFLTPPAFLVGAEIGFDTINDAKEWADNAIVLRNKVSRSAE